MKSKNKIKSYLILLCYLFAVIVGFFICGAIDYIYGADLVGYSGIYLLTIFPLATVLYGIISYITTKQLLLPNLLFLLFISVFMILLLLFGLVYDKEALFSYSILIEEIFEAVPFIVVLSAISAVFSLITMLISKIFKAAVKKQPASDE